MPWRNGGGTTTEIAIAPEGARLDTGRFVYRVSTAEVATDGPFSRFAGYDRHIVLLAGAGMTLDCGAHGVIELHRFEPRAFSGDWEVRGSLRAGPVRDFNVIVDRARASSTLEALTLDASLEVDCPARTTCIMHVMEGALDVAETGDTLIAHAPFQVVPRGLARVALARVGF